MAKDNVISIPEYYKRFINSQVDLSIETKQCCPFHKEDTPSFSYSPERGTWRCFGACHVGGDVIDLHRKNFNLPDRATAKQSLYAILGVKQEVNFERQKPTVNELEVTHRLIYARAIEAAKTIDDWLELDYIMSFYPVDYDWLESFCAKKGNM